MNYLVTILFFKIFLGHTCNCLNRNSPTEITDLPPVNAIGCGSLVNLTLGQQYWITSPDYPSKYPSSTDCNWKLSAPFGTRIRLIFEHFVMQPGHFDRCIFDYFGIEEARRRKRFCGFVPRGRNVLTITNNVNLRFTSDSVWETTGFRIRLDIVVNKCSAYIKNTEKGTFSSPNYPRPYPPHSVCSWKIEMLPSQRIHLDCKEPFHIEGLPEKCVYDYLSVSTVGDESFEQSRRFCWTQGPRELVSVGNVMTILFQSNMWIQSSGFRCEFSYASLKQTYNFSSTPLPKCNCGQLNDRGNATHKVSRIVGGTEVIPNKYPWMAAILFLPGVLGCGGSLISDRYILTASHCFLRVKQPRMLRVALAQHDLRNAFKLESDLYEVERIILHPNFDQDTSLNDIALLRLAKKVIFTPKIQPICLPTGYIELNRTAVTAIGWGRLSNAGAYSDTLQEVSLHTYPKEECQTNYVNVITDEMVCAGDGNKDSCQGDSGGPLMIEQNDTYIQIGITSFGLDCGIYGVPGVYTRVDQYLDFISENALRSDKCVPLKANKSAFLRSDETAINTTIVNDQVLKQK